MKKNSNLKKPLEGNFCISILIILFHHLFSCIRFKNNNNKNNNNNNIQQIHYIDKEK
jgi:hypothetical protein